MTTLTPFPFVFVGDGIVEEDPNEWLRQIKLFALSRSENDKLKVFELCLAPGSPAEAWYDNLDPEKVTFKSVCQAFQKTFPGVQYAPLPAWIPLERLEMCVLREEDLGRDIEEEGTGLMLPAHVAYARRVQKLAAAIPDAEAQLVAAARHRLPPSVRAVVPKHVKSWDLYVDSITQVTSYDLLKIQERSGAVPGGAAASSLSRHESLRRSSYSRTASNGYPLNGAAAASHDLPAPHVVEFANGVDNGVPGAVPVHVSSGSEAGSPTSPYGPNYSPTRTMANGARAYYQASPTNGFAAATPYDRDTPSAPPTAQTRTWLQAAPSGAARGWQRS